MDKWLNGLVQDDGCLRAGFLGHVVRWLVSRRASCRVYVWCEGVGLDYEERRRKEGCCVTLTDANSIREHRSERPRPIETPVVVGPCLGICLFAVRMMSDEIVRDQRERIAFKGVPVCCFRVCWDYTAGGCSDSCDICRYMSTSANTPEGVRFAFTGSLGPGSVNHSNVFNV